MGGKDTDCLRRMLFLQTKSEMDCIAVVRTGMGRRQSAFFHGVHLGNASRSSQKLVLNTGVQDVESLQGGLPDPRI